MAQRFAGRGFLPKRPQRTIWRRHSITQTDRISSDALRHAPYPRLPGRPLSNALGQGFPYAHAQAHSDRDREPS